MVRALVATLGARLPTGWSVRAESSPTNRKAWSIQLRAPEGTSASLLIIERTRVIPRDLPRIVNDAAEDRGTVLMLAPYLSTRSREILIGLGANYADATGNVRIALERPAFFIETEGADRDPHREPRPLKSLKGSAAGRAVRALCDFIPPYGVRALAEASSTALGTVSRVVGLLEREALVERDEKKRVVGVDWPSLLRAWSQDYDVKTSNQLCSFLEPRGLDALVQKLGRSRVRYAVTGSIAAPPLAPPRLAAIYVDDASAVADRLELTPTDAGGNVWLLEPFDDVVYDRTRTPGFASSVERSLNLVCAAPTQVVVDLMTSPGRGPQEAKALIEKMQERESDWRHGL